MNNENLIDFVIYYLVANNVATYDSVYKNKMLGKITYTSLKFSFNYRKIEIRIYNPKFINVRIENNSSKICASLNELKAEIDSLESSLSLSR
jgi:hypothetical protein